MNLSKTLFAVLALFVVLGLASCQKGDTTTPVTSQNDVAIENFVFYTPDLSVPTDFTESTVESPAALAPPPTDPGTGTGGNTGAVAPLNPITKMLRDLK